MRPEVSGFFFYLQQSPCTHTYAKSISSLLLYQQNASMKRLFTPSSFYLPALYLKDQLFFVQIYIFIYQSSETCCPPPPHHPSSLSVPLPLIDNESVPGCLAGQSYLLSAAIFVSIHITVRERERGRGLAFPQETAGDLECSCLVIIALLTSPHIRTYLGCLCSPAGQLTDSYIHFLPLYVEWPL